MSASWPPSPPVPYPPPSFSPRHAAQLIKAEPASSRRPVPGAKRRPLPFPHFCLASSVTKPPFSPSSRVHLGPPLPEPDHRSSSPFMRATPQLLTLPIPPPRVRLRLAPPPPEPSASRLMLPSNRRATPAPQSAPLRPLGYRRAPSPLSSRRRPPESTIPTSPSHSPALESTVDPWTDSPAWSTKPVDEFHSFSQRKIKPKILLTLEFSFSPLAFPQIDTKPL